MANQVGLAINMHSWYSNNVRKIIQFHKLALFIIFGVCGGFFTYVFSKLLLVKPDGVYIGQPNAWSDWVVHISITNIFAKKPVSEWFLYHPFFAYGKLTYGFLVHLITAFFMRIGLSLPGAFFVVSVLLLFCFLVGLYFLYFQLSNSRRESVLGIFIFFTSSGIGFFRFWKHLSWNEILAPVQDYSRFLEYDWLAGNIPAAMLIPQRAFFIGVTIGVWVLAILLWSLQKKTSQRTAKKLLLTAGFLAGILPIAHMHSFITIVIVTGCMCWFNRSKFQLLFRYFVTPAAMLSILLYITFVHGGIEIDNFMTLSLGWTVPKTGFVLADFFAWIFMWLKLWGAFLPAVLFAFWLFRKEIIKQKVFSFYCGFLVVFLLANVLIFQPTRWDNTKLFAWVYLGLSILVAKLILKLWNSHVTHKILTGILVFLLSTTGLVELFRIANFTQNTHLLSTTSEIALATSIAERTDTEAVFLTSTIHNHPIPLWANRPIFLGYLGWVRNFGFDHTLRDKQVYLVFSGSSQANQILKENKISYIFVGPKERGTLVINSQYLQQFPVAFQNEDTVVYDTRALWQ